MKARQLLHELKQQSGAEKVRMTISADVIRFTFLWKGGTTYVSTFSHTEIDHSPFDTERLIKWRLQSYLERRKQ